MLLNTNWINQYPMMVVDVSLFINLFKCKKILLSLDAILVAIETRDKVHINHSYIKIGI